MIDFVKEPPTVLVFLVWKLNLQMKIRVHTQRHNAFVIDGIESKTAWERVGHFTLEKRFLWKNSYYCEFICSSKWN